MKFVDLRLSNEDVAQAKTGWFISSATTA